MTAKQCPRCGTEIPLAPVDMADAESEHAKTEGDQTDKAIVQCPRCLLRPPWDTQAPMAITLGPGQSFVPPTVEELREHLEAYEVQALIGQGGMGAVYLGRQKSLDRDVAIKILPPEIAERKGFRDRFGAEGRALAKLNHPNIVSVFDYGEAGPYAMLVMELVEGANLREVMRQGRLSQTEALEIIPQLCDALTYAHEEGVVHRDIKPENLLFDARGRLKITDFGLAKLVAGKSPEPSQGTSVTPTDEMETTQNIVGTLHYMAPEQIENPRSVDHRADIYALGVVFYEMLTGELPLGRFDPPSELVNGEDAAKPMAVQIDVRLDDVVLRALEKQPEKRYPSAADIKDDIDAVERPAVDSQAATGSKVKWVQSKAGQARAMASRTTDSLRNASSGFWDFARDRFVKNPRVDIPAYLSLAIGVVSLVLGALASNAYGEGGTFTFGILLIGAIASFTLARVALRRESQTSPDRPSYVTRVVLAVIHFAILVPIVVIPIIAPGIAWVSVFGDPRWVDQPGWQRDWTQMACLAVTATSLVWFAVVLLHTLYPNFFAAIFRPFVQPTRTWFGIVILLALIVIGITGLVGFQANQYQPYTPGQELRRSDLSKLSPGDFRKLMRIGVDVPTDFDAPQDVVMPSAPN
ncbi:MAG: protein kinase [Planctomycetota bacterium]